MAIINFMANEQDNKKLLKLSIFKEKQFTVQGRRRKRI